MSFEENTGNNGSQQIELNILVGDNMCTVLDPSSVTQVKQQTSNVPRTKMKRATFESVSKEDTYQLPFEERLLMSTNGSLLHTYAAEPNRAKKVVQVILTNPDAYTCGICGKQYTDIMKFFMHKTQHGSQISPYAYTCELCKLTYVESSALYEHYEDYHALMGLPDDLLEECPEQEHTVTPDHIHTNTGNMKSLLKPQLLNNPTTVSTAGNDSFQLVEAEIKNEMYESTMESAEENWTEEVGHSIKHELAEHTAMVTNETATESDANLEQSVSDHGDGAVSTETRPRQRLVPRKCRNKWKKTTVTSSTRSSSDQNGMPSDHGYTVISKDASSVAQHDFHLVVQEDPLKRGSQIPNRFILQCLHCSFKSRRKDLLVYHMNRMHWDIMAKPEDINIDPNDTRNIMTLSAYEALLKSSRGRFKGKRVRNIEKQDLPGVFPCSMCNKVFIRLRYLRKHMLTHRTDKAFSCDKCGKSFKCATYLRVHSKTHCDKGKIFSCIQCDFKSDINAAIHAHRQIHPQGSVLCDTCGYAYTDRSTLAKHKRVHDLRRPYACNFEGCTWRFKTEMMCRAHIRAHTTEAKFKCTVCGYVFRHKHHLQRHMLNKHRIASSTAKVNNSIIDHTETVIGQPMEEDLPSLQDIQEIQEIDTSVDPEGGITVGLTEETDAGIGQSFLVVTTDASGAPITLQPSDIGLTPSTYQALLYSQGIIPEEPPDKGL